MEDQDTSPCADGVIDDEGRWRIPLGPRFRAVRSYRGGLAEVLLAGPYGGGEAAWTPIDAAGRPR